MFEMNAKIGPKIFMLKRMAVDLFFFLFLLAVSLSKLTETLFLVRKTISSEYLFVCYCLFSETLINHPSFHYFDAPY